MKYDLYCQINDKEKSYGDDGDDDDDNNNNNIVCFLRRASM